MALSTLLSALQTALLVLVGLSLAWKLITHLCTWTYFARRDDTDAPNRYEPALTIIKPVKGIDQDALHNFGSFCQQDYGSEYEILFCVDGPTDPCVPLIRRTMAGYEKPRMEIIFSSSVPSTAVGKIKKTIAGLAASSYDIIIFSDSDAYARPTFLKESVAAVQPCETGLAFGAPAYEGCQDWKAALMAVSVNELVLSMATPSLFGLFDGAVGTTMVMRKPVIEQIGGLERLGSHIVDDIPLSRAVRQQGYKVHLLKQPARIRHKTDTFDHWWSHWQRWQVIIRQYWPLKSLVMNVLDLALWWALFYLLVAIARGQAVSTGFFLVTTVTVTSLLSAAIINFKFVRDPMLWRFWWTVIVRDLCRLPLLIYSYRSREVVWRGERFRVNRDGTATLLETGEDTLMQQV